MLGDIGKFRFQELEEEKKKHAETAKLLASCRDTIDEIHGKNLDLESKVESLTRKNKRLESSENKLQDKCRTLQEELLATKEQLENEKRMHKTTKNKVHLLNQKER